MGKDDELIVTVIIVIYSLCDVNKTVIVVPGLLLNDLVPTFRRQHELVLGPGTAKGSTATDDEENDSQRTKYKV